MKRTAMTSHGTPATYDDVKSILGCRLGRSGRRATPISPYSPEREAFIKKSRAGLGCKRQALSDLRSAALGQNY